MLEKKQAYLTVGGSLRYDDPAALDLDLTVFSENPIDTRHDNVTKQWEDELALPWQDISQGGTDIAYINFKKINKYCDGFCNYEFGYLWHNFLYIINILGNASFAYTGYPLFVPKGGDMNMLQKRMTKLASTTPVFPVLMHANLEEALQIRRERRQLRKI